MGSRAVVVLCRDEKAARRRFGVEEGESGIVYTRTGRRFFNDLSLENELLERLRQAVGHAGLWDELNTDWLCLDCELMPWSAKAQELLREQYAPVGAAGRAGLAAANAALSKAAEHGLDVAELQAKFAARTEMIEGYVHAYEQYCWPVESLSDLKLAPFHLLASEGAVHTDKPHTWHMETLAKLALYEPVCIATACVNVDLQDEASCAAGIRWWEELTARGGEGMVVKPYYFITAGAQRSVGGLVQPAVKVRGREYLRIIYGPEYTAPENLERLRSRGLAAKRSLALREFALGLEGLDRFVRQEPLRRVHECAFAVLALESEPVDPRL
jgi:protein phosphatase